MAPEPLPDQKKKPGRPATGRSRSAAERKRDQRARDMTAIFEIDSETWTEAQCFMVLLSGSRFKKGSPLQKGAWERLGKLRGFM